MKANRILLSKIKMKNNCDCVFHETNHNKYVIRYCKYHKPRLN